jgi:hypothetical protein
MAAITFDPMELDVDGADVVVSQEPLWGLVSLSVDEELRDMPAKPSREAPGVWRYPVQRVCGHDVLIERTGPRFSTWWHGFLSKMTLGALGAHTWTWRVYVDGQVAAERELPNI